MDKSKGVTSFLLEAKPLKENHSPNLKKRIICNQMIAKLFNFASLKGKNIDLQMKSAVFQNFLKCVFIEEIKISS